LRVVFYSFFKLSKLIIEEERPKLFLKAKIEGSLKGIAMGLID